METNHHRDLREPTLHEVEMEIMMLAWQVTEMQTQGLESSCWPAMMVHTLVFLQHGCWPGASRLEPRFCPLQCYSVLVPCQPKDNGFFSFQFKYPHSPVLKSPREWQLLLLYSWAEWNGWWGSTFLPQIQRYSFLPWLYTNFHSIQNILSLCLVNTYSLEAKSGVISLYALPYFPDRNIGW